MITQPYWPPVVRSKAALDLELWTYVQSGSASTAPGPWPKINFVRCNSPAIGIGRRPPSESTPSTSHHGLPLFCFRCSDWLVNGVYFHRYTTHSSYRVTASGSNRSKGAFLLWPAYWLYELPDETFPSTIINPTRMTGAPSAGVGVTFALHVLASSTTIETPGHRYQIRDSSHFRTKCWQRWRAETRHFRRLDSYAHGQRYRTYDLPRA